MSHTSYITTTDTCSNCGVKLTNAETARLEYQKQSSELGVQLDAWHKSFGTAQLTHAVAKLGALTTERNHFKRCTLELGEQLAKCKDELRRANDKLAKMKVPLEALMNLEDVFVGLGNPYCDKAVFEAKRVLGDDAASR